MPCGSSFFTILYVFARPMILSIWCRFVAILRCLTTFCVSSWPFPFNIRSFYLNVSCLYPTTIYTSTKFGCELILEYKISLRKIMSHTIPILTCIFSALIVPLTLHIVPGLYEVAQLQMIIKTFGIWTANIHTTLYSL